MDYFNGFLLGLSFLFLGFGVVAGGRLRSRRNRGVANFFDYFIYFLFLLILLISAWFQFFDR
jgi:hypothetical protein